MPWAAHPACTYVVCARERAKRPTAVVVERPAKLSSCLNGHNPLIPPSPSFLAFPSCPSSTLSAPLCHARVPVVVGRCPRPASPSDRIARRPSFPLSPAVVPAAAADHIVDVDRRPSSARPPAPAQLDISLKPVVLAVVDPHRPHSLIFGLAAVVPDAGEAGPACFYASFGLPRRAPADAACLEQQQQRALLPHTAGDACPLVFVCKQPRDGDGGEGRDGHPRFV